MPRLPASELINHIEDKAVVIADGAMGTELMRRGALASETLKCNRTHPDWVKAIHHEYIEAGARLLYSNTFAPPKSHDEYADVLAGWQILREVCRESKEKVWAALSLYPATVIEHPKLMDQIFALPDAPDLVVIETCCSLEEAKKAVGVIQQQTDTLILVTGVFDEQNQLLDTTGVRVWAQTWKALDVDSFGANCGGFTYDYCGYARLMAENRLIGKRVHKPLLFKPNAGIPDQRGNYKNYTPEIWAEMTFALFDLGANIVGGCCGTTPEHIRALAQEIERNGYNKSK